MKKYYFFLIIIIFFTCSNDYNKGRKYFDNQQNDKAKEILLNIINEQNKYTEEQIIDSYRMLFIIYKNNNNNQAEPLIKEAIKIFPEYKTYYIYLLNYYLRKGEKEKFFEFYKIFCSEDKFKKENHYLGYDWYDNYVIKKQDINSKLDPKVIGKKFYIASDELVDFYLDILKINPSDTTAKHYLGKNLITMHKFKEAIPYLLESIENRIELKRSYYDLGVAYYNLNMIDKAREAVIKAKELGFDVHPDFLNDLGLN